jgi:hypothetical protein
MKGDDYECSDHTKRTRNIHLEATNNRSLELAIQKHPIKDSYYHPAAGGVLN